MNLKSLLLFASTFLLLNCNAAISPFLGKWKPLKHSILPADLVFTIKKEGANFILLSSKKPGHQLPLTYHKENDVLTGTMDGVYMTIQYNTANKHIVIVPQTNADALEFEKAP